MMRLRHNLTLRYALVMTACLTVLGAVAYHEFVREPRLFKAAKVADQTEYEWFEAAEVAVFASMPVIFCFGWWFIQRALRPIDELVSSVEHFHAGNLRHRSVRSFNLDEVDRLATAFNAMAGRVEQSFQQIQAFTLDASHELKTPLTIMRAELDTLLASEPLSAEQREALHSTQEEIERLGRIVDGLTLLMKADAGLVSLRREPVTFDELVRESAEDATVLAQPFEVAVEVRHCEPAIILGDRHRLRQVLLNLIDNATKYNRPRGTVTISLAAAGRHAELQLTNTGPGIPSDLHDRIFTRFVRGNHSRTDGIEGSGLGLAICKWIVEAHGGTISIASRPDQTTVTVRLPLAVPEPPLNGNGPKAKSA
jgi:signal transduction histidine kinase